MASAQWDIKTLPSDAWRPHLLCCWTLLSPRLARPPGLPLLSSAQLRSAPCPALLCSALDMPDQEHHTRDALSHYAREMFKYTFEKWDQLKKRLEARAAGPTDEDDGKRS
ncbi:uncharacterized protein FIBRA_08862 [Fibroporia radiculosa]|uniref:Uncharacterized protein n=1 Tax=Fibroporia radiculosa TaxID=599839 RepID=J4H5E2_9APHY|nr:uncharacterized protein FIBRA_08862 [Fibroporia radiculosa]CCM06584.1 predicted protein [Fibroporia radiculosa]